MTLTRERKIALDRYRGQLSYGKAIKKLLEDEMDLYAKGRADGYSTGYRAGHLDGTDEAIGTYLEILENHGVDSLVKFIRGDPDW